MTAKPKQRVTPAAQTENGQPWPKRRFTLHNLDFTDVLILLYVVVFVRQYLWVLHNNVLAWVLTVLLSVVICVVHVRTKEEPSETTPAEFWLVVALPLLVIYSLRVA